jgi:hypothetical protein
MKHYDTRPRTALTIVRRSCFASRKMRKLGLCRNLTPKLPLR